MPRPTDPRVRLRVGPRLRTTLALVLLAATLTVGALGVAATTSTAAEPPRTWVVDAVDDTAGNRWDAVDTGTSVVTIRVGDTVEWQFDRATQGHDLTSLAPSQPWESIWPTALQEYRDPGGASVTYTFTQPGTYRYQCSLHGPLMTGTIVVVPADDTNQSPTAAPVVEPLTGTAPHVVHATAHASDPDGDVVSVAWESGAGGTPAYTDHAMLEYPTPGTYVARLRVSDSRGGLHVEEFTVVVTGDAPPDPDPDPPSDGALPAIDALVAPAQGTAPLAVAFSTQVTTRGAVRPYSVGLEAYPAIAGEAVLVRSRGRTRTTLSVTGTKPSARHGAVHVHEQACDDELGGAHFRFDTAQPFAEPNEIWPLFTSDATGASGLVEVTKAMRAGPDAVSLVVHDPDNAARRIGCADLAPSSADLAYSWSFGDGTTGTGADPDHTYTASGTYTATVTVTHGSGGHSGHASVSDSVQVVVAGSAPPVVVPPAPTQPAPAVDSVPPRISRLAPVRTVRTARPVVTARVRDSASGVRKKAVVLRVDGRRATKVRWDRDRGVLRWRPSRALAVGRHVVRLVVTDAAGNRSARTWRFRVGPPLT